MNVKLLIEHHLEFLSLKGGCTGLFESTRENATLMEILCQGSYGLNHTAKTSVVNMHMLQSRMVQHFIFAW